MSVQERNDIQTGLNLGLGGPALARPLPRAPSSLSREIRDLGALEQLGDQLRILADGGAWLSAVREIGGDPTTDDETTGGAPRDGASS